MNDDSIVKIRVEKSDGKVGYGTGYRISHTHVLTALHVLKDKDGKTGFKFYFPEREKPVSKYIPDYSNKDYDIALITFSDDILDSLEKVSIVEMTAAEVGLEWYGCGYPKFATKAKSDDRDLEQIDGDSKHSTEKNAFFQVRCDKQVEMDKWGGISGAPLFDQSNNKLLGIVSSIDCKIQNIHFNVSAIWRLLQKDPDFLAYFAKKDALEKIYYKARELLDTNNLKMAFGKFGVTSNDIVSNLVAKKLPDMLKSLDKIKKKHSDKQAVKQVALQLLPHYFANQAVVIDEVLITSSIAVIDVDCVSDLAAECSIASFEGRASEIEYVVGKNGVIDYVTVGAKFAITPETGIGQGKADMKAFTEQILSESSLNLDTRLKGKLASSNSEENAVEIVNETLRYHKNEMGLRYYLVVSLDKNNVIDREKKEKLLAYKEKYPDFIILNLSADSELELFEKGSLELPLVACLSKG